jgi:hypothetical protein
VPASIEQAPAPDYSSFEAYRVAKRRDQGVAYPEAELRHARSRLKVIRAGVMTGERLRAHKV